MGFRPLVVGVLFLFGISLSGCREPAPQSESIRPVRAIKLADIAHFQGRGFPGRAEPVEEVELSFRVSGPLVELPIKVGDHVKKDALLAAIDPAEFQTNLDLARGNLARAEAELSAMEHGARPEEIEQLKAALTEAKAVAKHAQAEFARNEKLVKNNVVTQSEYELSLARRDQTAARVQKAEEDLRIGLEGAREEDIQAKRAAIGALRAAVADANNKLSYTTLKAPFEGDIAARYVDNFQTIQAKQPILRLLDTSKIEITLQVPENIISLVPLIKKVSCQFDAFPNQQFPGIVTEIGTEATRTTRTYPVKVQLYQPSDAKILPGMAATVYGKPDPSLLEKHQKLVVPISAVFTPETETQSYVWVVDENTGTVHSQKITTGKLAPGGIQVIEGLKADQWVVTAGVHSLQEGQKVRPLEQNGN